MEITRDILDDWCLLQEIDVDKLTEARLQLHHAAQIVAAMGKYLLPAQPDDSHTNMEWSSEFQALVGGEINGKNTLRGGLRLRDLTVLLIDESDDTLQEFPLENTKIDDTFFQVKESLAANDLDTSDFSLKMHYEIPHHAIADGQPFRLDPKDAFVELARYYGNIALLLEQLVKETPNTSEIRCWPHHFDIATLITVEENEDPEKAKTIGVGLSPGDGSYAMPYVYVMPWPFPKPESLDLPELAGDGNWHTEGWFGAALPANKIEKGDDVEKQARQFSEFISSAVAESRKFL